MSCSFIHPSALIDPGAQLAADVFVGPYAIIENNVVLEAGVKVEAHAQILSGTQIGANTSVGRGSIIGGLPQDLGFNPTTPSGVKIGEKNVLREHVTIHRATKEGASTTMGDGNYLMVGTHLAHDVVMGSKNTIANSVLFAGHVHLGSGIVVGGGSVFHQFLRIGDGCMIQGNSSISKDIPPFCMAGLFNKLIALNAVGLKRSGRSPEERLELKRLFSLIWRQGLSFPNALAKASEQSWGPAAQEMIDFVAAPSKKGVITMSGE